MGSVGKSPVNSLLCSRTSFRLDRLARDGILPSSSLLCRFRSSRSVRLQRGGIGPVRPLLFKFKVLSAVRLLKEGGMLPVRPFPDSSSNSRAVMLPDSLGISPANWLSSRYKRRSMLVLPKVASFPGIDPVSWLLDSVSSGRLARLPSSDGISPAKGVIRKNQFLQVCQAVDP